MAATSRSVAARTLVGEIADVDAGRVTAAPLAPDPDDQDWTWVLDRPCPQCGFDTSTCDTSTVGPLVRRVGAAWMPVLERVDVGVRPHARVWSPLEYACHVRDVFALYLWRLDLMLAEDDPLFDNWDQDATAIAERYDLEDASIVGAELQAGADALAERFEAVSPAQRTRTGRRSDGASFTVDTFARYMIHDPIHHLWDVGAT
jgi:hypothetical protein